MTNDEVYEELDRRGVSIARGTVRRWAAEGRLPVGVGSTNARRFPLAYVDAIENIWRARRLVAWLRKQPADKVAHAETLIRESVTTSGGT